MHKVVEQFRKCYPNEIAFGCIRNYCKTPAAAFIKFAKRQGYEVTLVYGNFVIDNPEFHFDDLLPDEKANMKLLAMDPRNPKDVEKFATEFELVEEFRRIPHYWNEYNGEIIDFTAQAQFVKSGLAADTDRTRYES